MQTLDEKVKEEMTRQGCVSGFVFEKDEDGGAWAEYCKTHNCDVVVWPYEGCVEAGRAVMHGDSKGGRAVADEWGKVR